MKKPYNHIGRFYFFLLPLLFLSLNISAQTTKQFEKAGDKALAKQDYFAAYSYYKDALTIDSSIIAINYKFGEAARLWNSFQEANWYFGKVYKSDEKVNFPLLTFNYALVKKHLQKYKRAKELFQEYLMKSNDSNGIFVQRARTEMGACDLALQLVAQPTKSKVEHLDKTINSKFSEFAPYPLGDELYYSSLRYKTINKTGQELYFSKILYQKGTAKGRPMGRKINLEGIHNANITFSHDGKFVYFTRC